MEYKVVANPTLIANVGKIVNNRRLNTLFKNVFDLDLSSLYPSIILSTNIDTETMLLSAVINRIGCEEEVKNEKTGERVNIPVNFAPVFMDTVVSRDLIKIAEEWCDMPSFDEILSWVD